MPTILVHTYATLPNGQNLRTTRSRKSSNEQSIAAARRIRANRQLRIFRRRPLNVDDNEVLGGSSGGWPVFSVLSEHGDSGFLGQRALGARRFVRRRSGTNSARRLFEMLPWADDVGGSPVRPLPVMVSQYSMQRFVGEMVRAGHILYDDVNRWVHRPQRQPAGHFERRARFGGNYNRSQPSESAHFQCLDRKSSPWN